MDLIGGDEDQVRKLLKTGKYNVNSRVNDIFSATPLHYACENGRLDVVRVLVSEFKADLTAKSSIGYTPLHFACDNGHLDVVRVLVSEFKADLAAKSNSGATPLHCACKNGHLDVVRVLVSEFKADLTAKSSIGDTPLHCACKNGHLDVVRVLVLSEFKADLTAKSNFGGDTPLHCACKNGHLNVVRVLVSEFKADLTAQSKSGDTPLHYACKNGHLNVVRVLVSEFKTDLAVSNWDGDTPLHCACMEGRLDVVRMLVSVMADLTVQNLSGQTVLHCACKKGHLDVVRTLMSEFKWDLSLQDDKGNTVLMLAVKGGHSNVVHALLHDYHCPVTGQDHYGKGVLHHACQRENVRLVQMLCEHGADVNLCNSAGDTPVQYAIRISRFDVAFSMLSDPCNVVIDSDGKTPLHYACEKGSIASARTLILEHKADVNVRSHLKNTPLLAAASSNQFQLALSLISEFGCDPNIAGYQGKTLLHHACSRGTLDLVRTLILEHKADVNARDEDYNLPLHDAFCCGQLEIVDSLIKQFNCDPNIADYQGKTLLHHACRKGTLDLVRTLIREHKADVNARDKGNDLPLHDAASCGQVEVVFSLIEEFNCDPSEPGILGRTCLHMASQYGHHCVLEQLLKIVPLTLDSLGNTPLHLASKANKLACVKALVHAKAPLLLRNSRGETPVDLAHGLSKKFLATTTKENHDQIQLDYSSILEHAKKRYSGSHSITRVFVIGNPGAGKSSFIKALKREKFFQSFRKVSESSVPPHTAGIIPSVHVSKQYGRLLFYDFAGDVEYYSSHAAIFESLASTRKGDNIFIVVVDLREDSATIETTLHYWFSFVQYQKFSRPLFAVVGSHLDLASEQVSKGQLLDQFCTSLHSHVHRIEYFMLDCRDPRSTQIKHLKKQIFSWISESPKYKISSSASVLLGLLEKDFEAVSACPAQTILEHINLSGACLPTEAKLLHRVILELHEVGVVLLLGDNSSDHAHVILNISKLTNEVHELIFSQPALSGILSEHTDSKTPLNIGIIPEAILSKILPPHITKECLIHLQYCQEISHKDVGFFPALAQEAESTDQSSFLFFPALCSVDKSQVPWDESTSSSFSIGWLALCNRAHDYFPSRFLHVLLLRLVYGFTLAPEEQDAHDYSRRCSMWKKGVHWLMEEGAEFVVELVNGNKGVIVFCKGYGREETCAGIFTRVVSCVLQAKAEFCHSIQPQYFFVDSSAEADYLSEDHQFPVSNVERGLARGNEFAVSVGNGRRNLELSKLKYMRKLTHWNSLFPMDSKSVLAYLRDIVPELYQLGEGLGVPRGVLLAIESNYKDDVDRRKRELVEWWMSSSEEPPCWWRLVQALMMIEHRVLAEKITEDHKSFVQLQEKILHSQAQSLKPDEEFLHSLSGVVGSRWPSLAVSLALSEEEIEGLKKMVGLPQQELALQMLKKWASREEATYGHLCHVLKTVSLFRCSD